MTPCIRATGKLCLQGYGRKSVTTDGVERRYGQHRWAYFEHHGLDLLDPQYEGMDVDHLCRATWCVNVEHLELVPHHENRLRGKDAGTGHWNAKLSWGDVVEMRELFAAGGVSKAALGRKFSVSGQQVRRIVVMKSRLRA